jgi:hypothetical protein
MNFFSIVVNFKFSLLMFRLCRAWNLRQSDAPHATVPRLDVRLWACTRAEPFQAQAQPAMCRVRRRQLCLLPDRFRHLWCWCKSRREDDTQIRVEIWTDTEYCMAFFSFFRQWLTCQLETDNISIKYNTFIPGFVYFDLKPNSGILQYYNENQEILHEVTITRQIAAHRSQCHLETAQKNAEWRLSFYLRCCWLCFCGEWTERTIISYILG